MSTITDAEVFRLAQYAYDKLSPLYERARNVEPTTSFHIYCNFSHTEAWNHNSSHIDVCAHWARKGMLHQDLGLTTEAEVDKVAASLSRRIAGLRAKK